MQSVSSRIWTRIAVFISYGDNDYTTGTSSYESDGDINCNWYTRNDPQSLDKGVRRVRNRRMRRNHPNYSITEIDREYWEVSGRQDKTYYFSDACERPSADAGQKNLQGVMIIMIIMVVDFAVPADHKVKIKESEKKMGMLWNMKMIVIPLVIGALRTVPKCLVRGIEEIEIRGRIEIISTTTSLR